MIANYIKELLFEQDCVVIPDFGGFIANYVSAEIHPIRHSFSPPSKSIAFNEMLRLNDGLLASYVAQKEGLSREDALLKIKGFLTEVWDELRQKNKYRLEEVGTLFLNQEQKIQFEPENRINYFNDSFGLPELLFKPIERTAAQRTARPDLSPQWNTGAFAKRTITQRMTAPLKIKDRPAMSNEEVYHEEEFAGEDEKTRASRLWLILAVPVVLLLAATTGLFLFFDDGNTVLSSFNPFTALYSQNKADVKSAESVATTDKPTPATLPPAEAGTVALDSATKESENWNAASQEPVSAPAAEDNQPTANAEPFDAKQTEAVKEEKVTPVEETIAKPAEKVSADYVAIATDVPRYYLIVGSFSRHKNALKLRKALVAKGVAESKLIIPKIETNLHKVSYADFATLPEANAKLEEVKSELDLQVWVFKYVK
ncbi:MAG: SPOR domain-containing protein [Bacteroidota bacterium]